MWHRKSSERLFIELYGKRKSIIKLLLLYCLEKEKKILISDGFPIYVSGRYACSRECSQLPSLSWSTFQLTAHCLLGGSQDRGAVELQ